MTHISMNMVRVKDLASDKMSLEADADWLADPKNPNLSYNMIGTEHLKAFARAILEAFPTYKFAYDNSHSFHVYRTGDQYTMGTISFADLRDRRVTPQKYDDDGNPLEDRKFVVFSPNIANGKYSYGQRENMAEAVSIKRAMTNVRKYLRPMNLVQSMSLTAADVSRGAQRSLRKIVDEAGSVRRKIVSDETLDVTNSYSSFNALPKTDALTVELKHLIDSGHEFVNLEFKQLLEDLFAQRDKVTEARSRHADRKHSYVETSVNTFGDIKYKVVRGVDVDRRLDDHIPSDNISIYTQADLPKELEGKLAVVQMLEDGQYVDDVGYRVSDGACYLVE
mgnify:CR=1 FL=1|tara:strand:+ start:651 stop:1658 length:1008 start_codon:yes stop_codon:yes gene_type:complete